MTGAKYGKNPSQPLLTSRQMREADRRTIEDLGLPGMVLMENAGAGVVRVIDRHYPKRRRVLILAGKGNNGGDGLVVARRLAQAGVAVRVLLFGQATALQGDAAANHDIFRKLGGWVREVTGHELPHELAGWLAHSDVVVDALFGTGLVKPLTGLLAQAVQQVNQAGKPVVAVDLPSGVCADTGRILGEAIRASHTVTFGAAKIGHDTWPGAGLRGHLTVVDIGIPASFLQVADHRVARNSRRDLDLPARRADGHKGSFGHLLVVAGSVGKAGAAVLTARGSQATGVGLVTVASPQSVQGQVACQLTEAMTWPLTEDRGCVALDTGDILTSLSSRFSGLAMGPGLGDADHLGRVVLDVASRLDLPLVLDADGLNACARQQGLLAALVAARTAPVVITPHPGELSRLLGLSVPAIQSDRLAVAARTAQSWGVWVVLKAAGTVIASPDGQAWINHTGNAGLAAGGSGDLLTGIMAGLLAQGWPVASAVRLAVWAHGRAADRAARQQGQAGMLASELTRHVRRLLNPR